MSRPTDIEREDTGPRIELISGAEGAQKQDHDLAPRVGEHMGFRYGAAPPLIAYRTYQLLVAASISESPRLCDRARAV
jgi:hypothetical protein